MAKRKAKAPAQTPPPAVSVGGPTETNVQAPPPGTEKTFQDVRKIDGDDGQARIQAHETTAKDRHFVRVGLALLINEYSTVESKVDGKCFDRRMTAQAKAQIQYLQSLLASYADALSPMALAAAQGDLFEGEGAYRENLKRVRHAIDYRDLHEEEPPWAQDDPARPEDPSLLQQAAESGS